MNLIDLKEITKDLNILYVEDDRELAEKTVSLLENFFDNSYVAYDGIEGLSKYEEFFQSNGKYLDIVISDIQMPGKNGVELAKDILQINDNQILIIISAYSDSHYLIELLNTGVTKFLSKPFNSDQLLDILYQCTIKLKNIDNVKIVELGEGFSWDKENKLLSNETGSVKLTKNEITLLDLLIENSSQIFSDEVLYNTIYFNEEYKDMSINSIRSMIKRLRKKLPSKLIENIYGNGYKIKLPVEKLTP